MKILVLEQPWAQLVCSGICDVVTVDNYFDYRGEVYVAVRGQVRNYDDFRYEWITEINNSILFGNIPAQTDWLCQGIIGKVEVVDCVNESYSLWQQDKKFYERYMIVRNASLFNESLEITIPLGKRFFEVESIEGLLENQTYIVDIRKPKLVGDKYVLPVSEERFDDCLYKRCVHIDMFISEDIVLSDIFDDTPSMNIVKLSRIELCSPSRKAMYTLVSTEEAMVYDEAGNDMRFKTIYNDDYIICDCIRFTLGNMIMMV